MTVCLTLPVAEAASCAFVAVAAAAFRASSWLRPRFDLFRGCGRDACDAQVCPNVFSETQNMQEQ
jgi:hypothetical protein